MQVFISYPREFEAAARALDAELKGREIHTSIDKKNLVPSDRWRLEIENYIKKSNVIVILYSLNAAKTSRYFSEEVELIQSAVGTSLKRIITVIFHPTKPSDLPEFFQRRHIVVSETTGILKDERDSNWIDQIVREVDRNILNRAKSRRQIISITTLALIAGSIALIALFSIRSMLFSGATIPPDRINLPTGDLFNDPHEDPSGTNFPTDQKEEDYKVVLGADEKLTLPGIPGELRVWIGHPSFDPRFPNRMARAESILPAVGKTAKVTPFAPAFEIDPKQSICMKVHATGSETQFKLIPTKVGTFDVGANVLLFSDTDCSGTPVPKSAETLQVTVTVNSDEAFQERTKQLSEIFWEKLKEFWGLSIALFFALLLFLIKGRLKKWFSFGNDK